MKSWSLWCCAILALAMRCCCSQMPTRCLMLSRSQLSLRRARTNLSP